VMPIIRSILPAAAGGEAIDAARLYSALILSPLSI